MKTKKDLAEIPKNILSKLDIKPVRWIDEVVELALTEIPKPLAESDAVPESEAKAKKGSRAKKGSGTVRHH